MEKSKKESITVYVVINEWNDANHCEGDRTETIFAESEDAYRYFKDQVALDKREGLGLQADKFPEDYENDDVEDGEIVIAEDNEYHYYVFEQGYAAGNYVEITCEEREVK